MITQHINETVTPDQLSRYAKLIYDRTGIAISPQKRTLLSNRLRRRLRETGIESYDAYFKHLSGLRDADPEWDAFLQEVTTHETYLFRDETHWKWFRERFIMELSDAARRGQRTRTLRFLSAACSTGDEPYTIATCLAACLPNLAQWKIDILGTDIGVGALEEAKAGKFGERAMKLVPDDYRKRFFTKSASSPEWIAKPTLTSMVRFRQHNLMDALSERPFDLVFVKNVLIYFDKQSKQKVLEQLRKVIAPRGLFVVGATEGISDLLGDFERIEPWLYRKN
jgi:chemotaxis protein methyltransferase CheR